ncbi:MAG: 50S ribosomal protein L18e [Candidatus Micrarchaeota archaeon]|nr:50S ribosomal protein L18e [Candidatus Micrarchaeota archaeon]
MRRIIEKDSINAWREAIATVKSDAKNADFWKKINKWVSMPRRQRAIVNLSKLDKMAKEGEFVVVPGKVLSFGNVSHKFKIAAVEYSESAQEKLKEHGVEIVHVDKMLKTENPRIIV